MIPHGQPWAGIRGKLLFTMIGLLAGLFVILTVLVSRSQSRVMQQALDRRLAQSKERLTERGRTLSGTLRLEAENNIAAYNFSRLSDRMKAAVDHDEDLSCIILMDTRPVALIHTLRSDLEQERLTSSLDRKAAASETSTHYEHGQGETAQMEFVEPIRFGGVRWGTLRLRFSLEGLNREIAAIRRQMEGEMRTTNQRLVATSFALLVLGMAVVLWYSRRITGPITQLTEDARRLAGGDFGVADTAHSAAKDEVGFLHNAFVDMAKNLRDQTESLQRLTEDFQGLIEHAPEGVIVHQDGVVTYANAAICDALQEETADRLLGKDILEWILPVERSPAARVLRGAAPDQYSAEWRFVAGNGDIRIMEVTSVASIRFGGQEASMLLTRDLTEQRLLEREIVQISTREQERFAKDLHDGLGQILTGLAYRGKMLEDSMRETSSAASAEAREIVGLANQALSQARMLARSIDPVELSEEGLGLALEALAYRTRELFEVAGTYEPASPPVVVEKFVAVHLYRIAMEAVTNAVRHGEPQSVTIGMRRMGDHALLSIRDDGKGITSDQADSHEVGMRNMRYRAQLISGVLQVTGIPEGGTIVTCRFPCAAPGESPSRSVSELEQKLF